jgi:hypothetical protein
MRSTHLTLFLGLLAAGPALGQGFDFDPRRLWQEGPAPAYTDLPPLTGGDALDGAVLPGAREPRLFRMPGPGGSGVSAGESPDVVMGADNPYFDIRRTGDFGGLGYQRFATQMMLAGDGATSFHLNLEAVTPAGLEYDGLAHGPSIVFPSLYSYHDLGDGSALIGFVGKPARASVESLESLDSNIHYGFAFQQPLLDPVPSFKQQVYVSVEALGSYRTADDLGAAPPGGWELIPGIHWNSSDRCWLSGGVLVPIGGARPDTGVWRITCSWQF